MNSLLGFSISKYCLLEQILDTIDDFGYEGKLFLQASKYSITFENWYQTIDK
ncbi:MAG: hypothetical protein MGG11_15280 [Trichodesmium sp. MAG_R03]|nr:hypothetical protein [Trichodesmium sp. MAG_R03]